MPLVLCSRKSYLPRIGVTLVPMLIYLQLDCWSTPPSRCDGWYGSKGLIRWVNTLSISQSPIDLTFAPYIVTKPSRNVVSSPSSILLSTAS